MNTLVLAHVTVIDATGAPAKPDMTVVIIGNHIAELGKAAEIRSAKNARTVNGDGKFLSLSLFLSSSFLSFASADLFLAAGLCELYAFRDDRPKDARFVCLPI